MALDELTDKQVEDWFLGLREGDSVAAQQLWNSLAHRIEHFAAQRLKGAARTVANEEDITISVFKSVMLRAERGEFEKVRSLQALWSLLIEITKRKVSNHLRNAGRLKRGGGKVVGEVDLAKAGSSSSQGAGLAGFAGDCPDPQMQALTVETIDGLLKSLGDPILEQVVVLKFQGYKSEEVAKELECSVATVERKLKMIKTIWKKQESDDDSLVDT